MALAIAIVAVRPVASWGLTEFVPSLTVAERYDTNVYFFSVGENLVDYVTTITPSLLVDHKGHTFDLSATATVTGEVYAANPGLNYIAPSGTVSLNLDKLVKQFNRHAGLMLTDSFAYTPRPPGFLAPESGVASGVSQDFVRGIQTIRANSVSNIAAASATYEMTQRTLLRTSYTHMFMRFGNVITPSGATLPVGPGGHSPFFTTKFQILSAGPEIKVTPRDVFTLTFQRQEMDFEVDNTKFGLQTHGGLVGWRRELNPEFAVSAAVGAAWLTPAESQNLQYLANGALEWTHNATTGKLSYSRTIFPSFFIAAAPLVSQVLTVNGAHKLAENLTATATLSYALNETIPAELARFEAYSAGATLVYRLTRTVTATTAYTHTEFIQGIVGQQFVFDRDVFMVSLKKEWR